MMNYNPSDHTPRLRLPYVPKAKESYLHNRKHKYLYRIAHTTVLRGNDYDERVLLFYGAPFALLCDACQYLFKLMADRVGDIIISREHSCRYRNGKCYWRVAVRVIGLDEKLLSFESLTLLILSRLRKMCNCTIRHYKPETFVNL